MILLTLAQAAAFDLACSGSSKLSEYNPVRPKEPITSSYTRVYHIDLQQKLFCVDGCEVQRAIVDIQPTQLVLERSSETGSGSERVRRRDIDRETGAEHVFRSEHSLLAAGFGETTVEEGQCEKRPFSGFPTPATKF